VFAFTFDSLLLFVTGEAAGIQNALKERTGQGTVPNVFIAGKHIGGCDSTFETHQKVGLFSLLKGKSGEPAAADVAATTTDMETTEGTGEQGAGGGPANGFDYDLIVIGGGSGGLAASKVTRLIDLFRLCIELNVPITLSLSLSLSHTHTC
jgi:hypothetical protein